jgi:glycosyltransferase involved in cell wall biosynthesis
VQSPSLVLATLAVFGRSVFGYSLVVDAHNEAVRPFDRPYAPIRWITRRLLKAADVTIVTNDALASDVQAAGGYPVVLADRLPEVPAMRATPGVEAPDVAVIATYRRDEPIDAIMAAAETMPDVRFAFSGPAARYRKSSAGLPSNVRLTGYLDEPEFWNLLSSATVICDLTLKPDCLVCGAYEALALAKPMVLSESPVNRQVFGPAAVFTDNSPEDISTAFRTALDERERLTAGARELRSSYPVRWQADSTAAWEAIQSRVAIARRRTA